MSFFSKIWAALKKFFTDPTVDQTIETTLTVAQPLIATLLTLTVGAPAAAVASAVIAKVQTGIAAVSKIAADVKAGTTTATSGAQSAISILQTVQTDLGTVLSAAQIKDPTTAAKVTAIVDSVAESLQELVANLSGASAPATAS